MNSGYSWTNTSQWSQIPTAPANQNGQQQPGTQPQPQPQQQNYPPQNAPVQSQPQQGFTPAEPRRDMITRLYRSILGREPDQAGLNYYLFNTNIPETQIAKEMYESTEHQDIIGRSKDVREMVTKLDEYNRESSELKTKLQNAESLNTNYKILLDQKTQIINSMKAGGVDPQAAQQSENQQNLQGQGQQSTLEQQGLILEDPFADDKPKGKGCIGWVKNILSFS